MTEEKKTLPQYSGMKQHNDRAGFSLWLPNDWHQFNLTGDHKGVLFSPYADDFNTGILVEKNKLKVKINRDDLPTLREAFVAGIKALDGVEIEEGSESEFLTDTLSFFEIRFSFLEGDARRKRWIRNVYWGRNNYILIAQGRTPEDFDHWLPMFYNIMMNAVV
ncbi:MAG: hypothetical protein IH586_07005 [Anaerolineaceae bacterium]|nr:hypothetical protein [Anaerolineaceae bacterium]